LEWGRIGKARGFRRLVRNVQASFRTIEAAIRPWRQILGFARILDLQGFGFVRILDL
jgi:hypothetical protein